MVAKLKGAITCEMDGVVLEKWISILCVQGSCKGRKNWGYELHFMPAFHLVKVLGTSLKIGN